MHSAAIDRAVERFLSRWVFYGWAVVLVTFTTSMITAGISGYGMGFFVVPMGEELGISRTEFSGIALFRLALLPVVPFLGMLVDRKHGPRVMIVVGSIVAGIALMFTSCVNTLWEFYIIQGVFFGLATHAMGGMLIGPSVISKWFIRMRGRAMAVGTMGISTGGVVIAPLSGWVVSQYGWRTAWVVLGFVLMLALAPLAALLMRRSPEDAGMLPDGDSQPADGISADSNPAGVEVSLTLKEAMRTRSLWVLMIVQALTHLSLMPVMFHQVAYIQDKGFEIGAATTIATMMAFFAVVSKLPWGILCERVHVRWVTAVCLTSTGLALMLLVVAQSMWMLVAYAVLFGLMMGGFTPTLNVAWATYFGRKHMGAIRGFVTPAGNIVGAFGPIFAGWTWSEQSSYDFSITFFALAWITGGLLMLIANVPSRQAELAVAESAAKAT
ncbi:MAG: MFS transporter [SAR202 cluster bacterium]|jgi:MFS family permease|nr:hypothetical protein [Chloroflexota bacterium]MDP6662849.1 MFS transporter [SAR202 cluster bacterium]MDP6801105.1 MFS transporter [SAR202 cluster bacterium]MQG56838.1 MFS transporter [SAR202 cluster bacterium]MQG69788.1 MFS transporter [SAR202 cluster bacterium]|tara:strand:- start:3895 stop:5214 length:1320 start_codon:yes stop_codon:yes gene_type:complete